jgi:hypothetical protein
MVDLLLKSGANRGAKSKEGRTAAELARSYNYPVLIKSLGAN